MARAYYIVNPKGVIFECTREHAHMRLKKPGWRVPTAPELKEFKRQEREAKAGYKVDEKGKKIAGERFVQTAANPIAEPFTSDPDKAIERIERELEALEAAEAAEDQEPEPSEAKDAPEIDAKASPDEGDQASEGGEGETSPAPAPAAQSETEGD